MDYRPYRERHPQESPPETGDTSTYGNIPTGVALIKRSQRIFRRVRYILPRKQTLRVLHPSQRRRRPSRRRLLQESQSFCRQRRSRRTPVPPARREHPCCRRSIVRLAVETVFTAPTSAASGVSSSRNGMTARLVRNRDRQAFDADGTRIFEEVLHVRRQETSRRRNPDSTTAKALL